MLAVEVASDSTHQDWEDMHAPQAADCWHRTAPLYPVVPRRIIGALPIVPNVYRVPAPAPACRLTAPLRLFGAGTGPATALGAPTRSARLMRWEVFAPSAPAAAVQS